MLFPHEIPFEAQRAAKALSTVPPGPAVFCLRGSAGEPYLNRTQNLRSRLARLLMPAPSQSRRLQLAGMVRYITWAETASEFEAMLLLYRAVSAAFGERASARLHLRPPSFLRMTMKNRFPRIYVTHSITYARAEDLFGPFASRGAAERYAEQMLELFLLRRCFQDLAPDPEFPGCIYSEIKKCLAPCFAGCTDERYASEAAAVHAFLRTGGQSLLAALASERDRASEALDFEQAAAIHARRSKVEAVAALAGEAARSLVSQHAVLIQPSPSAEHVLLYLLRNGVFTGPAAFSVQGMLHQNEQSGSSSLFAHPVAFAPIPLGGVSAPAAVPAGAGLDERLRVTLLALERADTALSKRELCDHQALFVRWYYGPQKRRTGEVLFADQTRGNGLESLPRKAILRAISRVYRAQQEQQLKSMQPTPAP